jgi:hypothetical protein
MVVPQNQCWVSNAHPKTDPELQAPLPLHWEQSELCVLQVGEGLCFM